MLVLNNHTEEKLTGRFMENQDWVKTEDGKREIRIGVLANCNGEIPKHKSIHETTSLNMIQFLKNNKIKSFSIHTIDNNEEYSNCLKLDEHSTYEVSPLSSSSAS